MPIMVLSLTWVLQTANVYTFFCLCATEDTICHMQKKNTLYNIFFFENTSMPFCFCTPQNSIFESKTGIKSDRFEVINDFGPKTSCFISKPTNHTKSTVCIDFYGNQNSWIFCKQSRKRIIPLGYFNQNVHV